MWLICKTAFRKGASKLLIRGVQGAEWVFCPKINNIKNDRVNVQGCRQCTQFIRFEQTAVPQTHCRPQSLMPKRVKGHHFIKRPVRRSKIKPSGVRSLCPSMNLTKEKQPIVDVFEEEDYVLILAELPGMDKENVKVQADENIVTITAENATKKYSETVKLPTNVSRSTIKFTCRNNVLQAKVKKQIV